jgi:DNA N-6-adenine-methyltransferase (Dam)
MVHAACSSTDEQLAGRARRLMGVGRSILISGKSEDWYTPARYIEAARKVMGSIDLDPASCELANSVVKANHYYTKEDNGLSHQWYGCIWLNPPYGRNAQGSSRTATWVKRLLHDYTRGDIKQAILLLPSRIETQWFQLVWGYPICFANHRISFHSNGKTLVGNIIGSAFVYLGPHEQKFIDIFSVFGRIVKAIDVPHQPLYTSRSLWEVSA